MHYLTLLTTLVTFITFASAVAVPAPAAQGGSITNTVGDLLNGITSLPVVSSLAGNSEPPLMTSIHSLECLNINRGTLMCCQNTLDGGNAAVQLLATLAGYQLTKDTINGIGCYQDQQCAAPLCCEVIEFTPLLAMYCAPVKV